MNYIATDQNRKRAERARATLRLYRALLGEAIRPAEEELRDFAIDALHLLAESMPPHKAEGALLELTDHAIDAFEAEAAGEDGEQPSKARIGR